MLLLLLLYWIRPPGSITPNHCCPATKRVGSSRFWKIKDAQATFKVKICPSFRTQLYKVDAHWQHIKGISIEKNLVTEVRSNEKSPGRIRNHFTPSKSFKILHWSTKWRAHDGSDQMLLWIDQDAVASSGTRVASFFPSLAWIMWQVRPLDVTSYVQQIFNGSNMFRFKFFPMVLTL